MNQLWQYWSKGIDETDVSNILGMSADIPWIDSGLGFDGSTTNNDYRRSQIKWLDPRQFSQVRDMIWHFAEQSNRNAFGFDINMVNDIQLTEYKSEDQGKYDWHHDTFWANPRTFDRKLSVVIQLSDPDDYVGGNFELDNQYEAPNNKEIREKGTVIVFPSFINHRVTPVTKGTRHSLVSWIEGPKFR